MTDELNPAECWHLIKSARIGRLAVSMNGRPDIFPVNFVATDEIIYFRTAPGSKLMELTLNPFVAFEVDGRHLAHYWSVVIAGSAERMDRDDEIERSGVLNIHTASSTDKWNYVRVTPTSVTGRRV